jgi:radical SAM protein with 4Fe4S-binding SPASM domain
VSTDPLLPAERAAILARPRPNRALPIFPPEDARRIEPLAEARDKDAAYRPIVAVWEITLRCDLACRHCGSRAGKERPNEMTTAECLDLVRQLAEIGTREVALIGGEAYLRDDWVEIIRAIKSHGMMPTMTTGGRGLTRERAEAAGKAGLYSASVSIDGEEATHDRLRGVQGSWRAALDAMANLRAAGVFIAANTQINRLSMPDLPQVLERIGVAGAKSWQIQLTVAMGRAADEPDVLLQPYDLLELFPMLAALTERAKALRVNIVAGNNIGYFGPYETALRGRTRHGHSTGCGAGKLSIGIEADGAIKGCPSLATKTWTGGNVRETPLRDIWERSNALRYQRDRGTRDLWGYCGTCYYAEQCKAGCTWTTDVLFGRPGNNPFCHHRALEHDKQGLRERIVPVAPAPGEPFDHGLFELVVEPKPAQATQAAETTEPAQTTQRSSSEP